MKLMSRNAIHARKQKKTLKQQEDINIGCDASELLGDVAVVDATRLLGA